LQSEHLRFLPEISLEFLVTFLNSCLSHSYLPLSLLEVCIKPIIKKKGLSGIKSCNYRPIAIATSMSKLLEHLILAKYSKELTVGYWQFGYRKNLGTEMAVFALKNVIRHYNGNGSPIFTCFLDASKAFDCVLHEKLCTKLLKRNVPMLIVKLFYVWCKTQRFKNDWVGNLSRDFGVFKSVRQGGVLSPYLFNVYMDELGATLANS